MFDAVTAIGLGGSRVFCTATGGLAVGAGGGKIWHALIENKTPPSASRGNSVSIKRIVDKKEPFIVFSVFYCSTEIFRHEYNKIVTRSGVISKAGVAKKGCFS